MTQCIAFDMVGADVSCFRKTIEELYPSLLLIPDYVQNCVKPFLKEKFFPKLGLDNCEEKIDGSNSIVFSGSGDRCLWDLATMSQRGVRSCQSWDRQPNGLIGSIIDPYCAIVYKTDDTIIQTRWKDRVGNGRRMLFRSLVRFVISSRGMPALFMERLYVSGDYNDGRYLASDLKISIINQFESFLNKKTGLPIVNTNNCGATGGGERPVINYAIPYSPTTKVASYLSYRDSCIEYKDYAMFSSVPETFDKNIVVK